LLYCGCEVWSFTVREEHRLRVFENKVLRKTFGRQRDGVTGDWRKNIMRQTVVRPIKSVRIRWAGHVARETRSKV
jgi:glutamine amidotransferase PdxT